jgi:hypothetical protein
LSRAAEQVRLGVGVAGLGSELVESAIPGSSSMGDRSPIPPTGGVVAVGRTVPRQLEMKRAAGLLHLEATQDRIGRPLGQLRVRRGSFTSGLSSR